MTAPGELHRRRDENARTAIRQQLDANMLVEAGAGTGKTRALVDRMIALILEGRSIERIIAITFTEKAAAELKDRVRAALEGAREAAPANGRISAALLALDRAHISTIHAFGLSLMRAFAAEARTDPGFAVRDEMLAERRFEECWRLWLRELGNDPRATQIFGRVLGLGLGQRDLQTLAHELARLPGVAADVLARPLVAAAAHWPNLEPLRDQFEALPLDAAPADDPLRLRVEQIRALAARLSRAPADARELVLANDAALLEVTLRVSNAAVWGVNVTGVRSTTASAQNQLAEVLAACRASALADLLPLVARFVRDDAVARHGEGTLIFDDLILGPRDLLREQPHAVRILRDRFDTMLIDEFQDTDPLQVDIATAFATDPDTGAFEPGRLFLVGDPKQSIYRFRRADMAVYARTRDRAAQDGAGFSTLSLNRRSRTVIVDWVNRVFETIIGDGARAHVQPPYEPLYAERDVELHGPGVAVIGGPVADTARAVRQREAGVIAGHCAAALRDGWQIQERDGAIRRASYRDIAVLIPTRAILASLERAFQRARISYRVEGGNLIYQTQEVRDLINCLTAIDDPADEVAIVGALRSTAYACSDVDLARHRAAGGRFNYLAPDADAPEGSVRDGLRSLKAYHDQRHEGSLAALVERFVADRGQDEIGLLFDTNRDSFRRMRFVVEQARAFESSAPESLRAFVSWLERRAGNAILAHEGSGLDDDEDAVRILTIHGAKGLEFPIVFVAGLGAKPNTRPPVIAVDRATGDAAIRLGAQSRNTLSTLGDTTRLHALERDHAAAEFERLLYVAATRARDHLVLSLFHSAPVSQCGARRLLDAGAREAATELAEAPVVEQERHAAFQGLVVDLPTGAARETFAERRQQLIDASRQRRYVSATSLAALAKDEPADESEPWARGRGGTRLGRAVHATLQSVPLDAHDDVIVPYARAQAVAEAVPELADEVAELVRRALSSEAAGRARRAIRALREVPFGFARDGVIIEGFIDLVIEDAEGIEIVDWKTDRIAPEAVPGRLKEYELQASLYVAGLEAATGRRVTRVAYVFVSAGVEVSPGDPVALRTRASGVLSSTINYRE